jgi:hypothetical protein
MSNPLWPYFIPFPAMTQVLMTQGDWNIPGFIRLTSAHYGRNSPNLYDK